MNFPLIEEVTDRERLSGSWDAGDKIDQAL